MTSASRPPFRSLRFGLALFVLPLALALPRPAAAEPVDALSRTAARELALEGAQHFEQGNYGKALDRFRRAFAVFPAPSIALMEARSLVRLGRWVEAADKYEETLRTPLAEDAPEAFRGAVANAAHEVEELKPRIPRLTIQIDEGTRGVPGFAVTLDGAALRSALWGVALPVDPGSHTIRATATGRAPDLRTVTLSERGHELVKFDLAHSGSIPSAELAADTSSSGSTRRVLAWTAIGVGALGVGASAVTGVIALGKKSDLDGVCRPGCPASAQGDIDAFRTHRTVSYVSLGVGAAALAVGGYLLFGADEESPRVGAFVVPGGAALTGTF